MQEQRVKTKRDQCHDISQVVNNIPDFKIKTGTGKTLYYRVIFPESPTPRWILQRKNTAKQIIWVDDLSGGANELVQLVDAVSRRLGINKFNENPWTWSRYLDWLLPKGLSDAVEARAIKDFQEFMPIHCG